MSSWWISIVIVRWGFNVYYRLEDNVGRISIFGDKRGGVWCVFFWVRWGYIYGIWVFVDLVRILGMVWSFGSFVEF